MVKEYLGLFPGKGTNLDLREYALWLEVFLTIQLKVSPRFVSLGSNHIVPYLTKHRYKIVYLCREQHMEHVVIAGNSVPFNAI